MASFGGHATAQRQMVGGVSFRLDGRREKVGNKKKRKLCSWIIHGRVRVRCCWQDDVIRRYKTFSFHFYFIFLAFYLFGEIPIRQLLDACRLFWWGIRGHGVKKNWCTTHFLFLFFHLKVERRNKRGQASIRDNIYKIDKLLWALTWGSSSYFSSFRPPERDGQNKKRSCFGGDLCVWWREEIWRWQPCVDITGW